MPITFFVRNIGFVHIVEPGLTAGRWQSDEIQMNLEIFKIHYVERFDFLLHLSKVQHHYSSRNAFQVFFQVKFIVKLIFKMQKFMKPYDFLPIPTIKYYHA